MKFIFRTIFKLLFWLSIFGAYVLLPGCANIVPPAGGPVDTIAPRLLSVLPADSSLQLNPKKLELNFDKFMVLGSLDQVTISPQIRVNPIIEPRLRKVLVTFADSVFLPNTTYSISFGDLLRDNREGTPYEFTYTFSTGTYFDSLAIEGFAFDAKMLRVDTGLTAALYADADFSDSLIFRQKPLYVAKVSSSGRFKFVNLPPRDFRLFVFQDAARNGVYEPGIDRIAAYPEPFVPGNIPDSVFVMKYYLEEVDSVPTFEEEKPQRRAARASDALAPDQMYRVLVDTVALNRGSQELHKPLTILKSPAIAKVDPSRVFLTFERSLVDVEAIHKLEETDSTILLHTEWFPDAKYTLRLVKGWATDTAGNEVVPGRYHFLTKRTEEYATLTVLVPGAFLDGHYIRLFNGNDSVTQVLITDSSMKFEYLTPGTYSIFIFSDLNEDGAWTPGNYLSKLAPEPVYIHKAAVQLRPGWEMEETFEGTDRPRDEKPSMQNDARSGVRSGEEMK